MNSTPSATDKQNRPGTPRGVLRFSQISAARQALVRLCQAVNFGALYSILLRAGDPIIQARPLVVYDLKFDVEQDARPEVALEDFDLCQEVCRLLAKLDEIRDGRIERIEIRAGIPRRMVIETSQKAVLG